MVKNNEFQNFRAYFEDMPKNVSEIAMINFSLNGEDAYNVVDDLKANQISADASLAASYSKLAHYTKEEITSVKNEELLKHLNDPNALYAMALSSLKEKSNNLEMGVRQ